MAAVASAFLLYTGIVPVRDSVEYASVVPISSAVSLDCRLCSSPSRSSKSQTYGGGPYTCAADVMRSCGDFPGGQVLGDAVGRVRLSIPADMVESLYPGKLYSGRRGGFIMEDGAAFRVAGSWNARKGAFEVLSAENLGWGTGLISLLRYVRAWARLCFRRFLYSWGRAGGLVLALLSGARDYLDADLSDSFRRAGLSHVLALSGMHLSLFSSLLGKRRNFFVRFLCMACFVFFAGFSPSLFRAFLCALLLSACGCLHVPGADGKAVLGCVFLLHVLLRRGDIYSPAFMLSYGAMAGILLLSDPVHRLISPFVPPVLATPLAPSVAAFIATAPISFCIFGFVAPAGILASVIVSSLIGLFMLLSLVLLLLAFSFPVLAPVGASVLNVLLVIIEHVVGAFAAFPVIGG